MDKDNAIIFKEELSVPFKGAREYIYASDIFMLIVQLLEQKGFEEILNIDFSVHSLSSKGVEILVFKDQLPAFDYKPVAQIRFESKSEKYFGIIQSTDKKISDRTAYDEDEIYNNSEINSADDSIVLLNGYEKYSNLDIFTSMNKRLLYTVRPDIEGKWLSVRLQLENYKDLFQKRENFSVELKKIFSNKYAKSSLIINSQKIGNLFFSLQK